MLKSMRRNKSFAFFAITDNKIYSNMNGIFCLAMKYMVELLLRPDKQ